MRILLLSDNYWPRVGGAETYVYELGRTLAVRGHDVTVYTDGPLDQPGLRTTVEGGVTVVRDSSYWPVLQGASAPWEHLAFGRLPALAQIAESRPFDVVHANNHDTVLLAAVLKLQTGVPVVFTSHEVGRQSGPLGTGRLRLVMQSLPVDVVLAMSEYYAREAQLFGARRVERVYIGVDTEKFAPGEDTRPASSPRLTVLCLARFKPRKGLSEYVQAASILATRYKLVDFVLAGSASSTNDVFYDSLRSDIEALSLGDRVLIRTDVPFDRVPEVLQAADVVVQPSHSEGLGIAVLEAMACGKPVVVSATTGLDEIVTHGVNGLVVSPGDSAQLANAIASLIASSELRGRLGSAGRQHVRANFNLEHMVTETERVYNSLIKKTRG